MNEIIVAIDFSDCSINALEHAITIANKAELDVYMVWVERSDNTKFILEEGSSNDIKAAVEKKFEYLIRKYKIQLKKSKIEYTIKPEGKVFKEIVKIANSRKATLIITGTHGASGFEEFWIGSNANRMVSASNCPIITIRLGRKVRKPLRKIVMPIDSSIETRQKVPFTAQLASLFGAEIHILGLFTSNAQVIRLRVDNYVDQVAKYLDDMDVKYKIEKKKADNLTKATLEYAKEVEGNLISIMSEQETSTSNLWYGSYAQQMVNHSPVPVLTIKAKEYIRSLSR